jgi:hypothetical protein
MKKSSSMILLLFCAVLAGACSKSDVGNKNSGNNKTTITLSGAIDDTGTKVNFTDPEGNNGLKVYWSATDRITVVNKSNSNETAEFTTTGNTGTSKGATFTGTFATPDNGDLLYAYYPASSTTSNTTCLTMSNGEATVDLSTQDGTLLGAKKFAVMSAAATYNGGNVIFHFQHQTAIIKITLTFPNAVTLTGLTLTPMSTPTPNPSTPSVEKFYNKFKITNATDVTGISTGEINVNLSAHQDIAANGTRTFYVVVYGGTIPDLILTAHTTSGDYIANTTTVSNILNGNLYHMNKTVTKAVGCYYYGDGTWGPLSSNTGKTPIAVIFSTSPSSNDITNGFTHGYAMCLKQTATDSDTWNWALYSGKKDNTNQTAMITDHAAMAADLNGYFYCHPYTTSPQGNGYYTFNATDYPMLYSAMNYGTATYGGVTNAAPSTSSGWFLPSIGQYYLFFTNLAGVTCTYDAYGYINFSSSFDDLLKIYDNINSYIKAAAAVNTTINTAEGQREFNSDYLYFFEKPSNNKNTLSSPVVYFSSTEYSVDAVCAVVMIANSGSGSLQISYNGKNNSSHSYSPFVTRTALAF